jgi:3-oxoacyl-[acyl-carrier-protein] synthase-3
LEPGTVLKKSGVKFRYYADPQKETNSKMAAWAAEKALEEAGLEASQLDAIIGASGSVEQILPNGAVFIQKELGLQDSGIPCFSIDSTCLSFVTALDTLSYMLEAGRFENVLIVSSELASVGLNWKQPESASLFGDGAVAFVIGRADAEKPHSKILSSHMETYSSGAHQCEIAGGGSRINVRTAGVNGPDDERYLFSMDGPALFETSLTKVGPFMKKLLGPLHLGLNEMDLIIPHQASLSAMNLIKRSLQIRSEKWLTIIPEYGNMIAACIPLGLHLARTEGKLHAGDKVLLCGTSAGLSLGGMVIEY